MGCGHSHICSSSAIPLVQQVALSREVAAHGGVSVCYLHVTMSERGKNEDTLAAALCSTRDDIRKVLETARRRFKDNEKSAYL